MLALLFKLQSLVSLFKWLKKALKKDSGDITITESKIDYKAEFEALQKTYSFTVQQFQSQIYTLTEFYQSADRQRGELSTRLAEVEEKLRDKVSKERSEQVRMGQISEVCVPFHESFPHNPKNLRPLFQPIDYIAFNENEIVFIEFKSGNSQLTEKQKRIKMLVESGKVKWETHQLNEKGYNIK